MGFLQKTRMGEDLDLRQDASGTLLAKWQLGFRQSWQNPCTSR